MEKIDWNPSFSVGVEVLDKQHKQIVGMINLLRSNSKVDVRSEVVSELLTRLTKYASDHFVTEERLLEKYGYPELTIQKEAHKAYRMKVAALCQDTIRHKTSVPEELLQFLGNWWVNHILKTDMRYRLFFMERGVT